MKQSADKMLYLNEEAGTVTLSLTPAAQEELGKITFVNFPKVGTEIVEGTGFIEVEAEKAVNELVAPVSGAIVAVNDAAQNDTSILDSAEAGVAWLVRVKLS